MKPSQIESTRTHRLHVISVLIWRSILEYVTPILKKKKKTKQKNKFDFGQSFAW